MYAVVPASSISLLLTKATDPPDDELRAPFEQYGREENGTGLNCLGAVRVQYPDIVYWLHYLDEHPDRNDGIQFSQYAEILKEHGFIRVSQLSADFVTPRDLAD